MTIRFSDNLQQMIREMRALFGEQMWDNLIVGVNKWSFSASNVAERNKTCVFTPKRCRDEQAFSMSMMRAIEAKFHVGRNLTFAFVDSWAKHPMNLNDELQQEAFRRKSNILWNFALNSNELAFKSIQDVLEENHKLIEENEELSNVLKNNITEILNVLRSHELVISRLDSEQIQISEDVASKLTCYIAN